MPFVLERSAEKHHPRPTMRKAVAAIWGQAREIAAKDSLIRAALFFTSALHDPLSAGEWLTFLDAFARRHELGRARIDCVERPIFNYAVHRLSIAQRASILKDHYSLIGARLPSLLAALWSATGVELGFLHGKHGEQYRLALNPAGYCYKEGELSFSLSDTTDGLELAKLTFLFIHADGEPTLLIGGVQGPSSHCGPGAKARIVAATRALSGLRPKMAVFVAACALARGMGAESVFAVSNKTHSINADAWWQRRKMHADYDGFWLERGGTPDVLGFKLAAQSSPRSDCKRRNEQRALVEELIYQFSSAFDERTCSSGVLQQRAHSLAKLRGSRPNGAGSRLGDLVLHGANGLCS